MRVFIQQKHGRFPNVNYFQAWLGFQELGHETVMLEEDDFASTTFGVDSMAVGEIPLMLAAFAQAGATYAHLPYIPLGLMEFAGRRVWTSTLEEVRERVAADAPVFAKPLEGTPRRFKG